MSAHVSHADQGRDSRAGARLGNGLPRPPGEHGKFVDPPNRYRPLQIVHGFDSWLSLEDDGGVHSEQDPAGQWAERLTTASAAVDSGRLASVDRHLARLAAVGLGGIVTNVGFQDYLVSPQQWELLRYGQRRAAELGLRVWLYDEMGYPSGTAGGIVSRAFPEFVALGLACYVSAVEGPMRLTLPMTPSCRRVVGAVAMPETEMVAREDLVDLGPAVDEWQVVRWEVPEGRWTVCVFAERVMYEGTHSQGNVSAFKHYINLLEPAAVRAFLRVTHEAYRRELPDTLWENVEAFFTDEPSFMTFYVPPLPDRYHGNVPVIDAPLFKDRPPAVPWKPDFLESFCAETGYDLQPYLYALFFSQSEEACYVRQDYYACLTKWYSAAFYGQVQDWCQAHGVASSGHVLLEENILDHVAFHGSLFAVIRRMDLPGIDMLNSDPHAMMYGGSFMGASFMAVKQVSSAAHLTGAVRVHSESSDWEQRNQGAYATLAERRGQANLQYVLGVNQITSYFGWQEFSDADQRDYHDYVGRLGAMLTGGRHICDVAVLYPIRTLWAHYLPPLEALPSWTEHPMRSEWQRTVAETYPEVVRALLSDQLDLDIVDEQALLEGESRGGAIHVADEAYRVLVLPPLDTLALETVLALKAFCENGGILFSVAGTPDLAAARDDTPRLQAEMRALFGPDGPARVTSVAALAAQVREAISADVTLASSDPDVLVTHRWISGRHVYFVINNRPDATEVSPTFREPGLYDLYRPLTGSIRAIESPLTVPLEGYEGVFLVTSSDSGASGGAPDEEQQDDVEKGVRRESARTGGTR